MAIFSKKSTNVSLVSTLAVRGSELRGAEQTETENSKLLFEAAKQSILASETHAKHAAAVEQAVKILDDAGVQL